MTSLQLCVRYGLSLCINDGVGVCDGEGEGVLLCLILEDFSHPSLPSLDRPSPAASPYTL